MEGDRECMSDLPQKQDGGIEVDSNSVLDQFDRIRKRRQLGNACSSPEDEQRAESTAAK
jgi:hypothetical protein